MLVEYEASGRRSPLPARRAKCIIQLPDEGATVVEAIVDLSSTSPAVINWLKVGHSLSLYQWGPASAFHVPL